MNREYIENGPLESPAFKDLRKYVEERSGTPIGQGRSFEEHEKELGKLLSTCEAELLAVDLARYDVEAPYITVDGVRYRRAIRAERTYVGQAGSMRVARKPLPAGRRWAIDRRGR